MQLERYSDVDPISPKTVDHIDTPPDLTPLVLLVDDQEWTSRSIESILRPKGHVVLKAYTGKQALDLVKKVSPDVVLVDLRLPDVDGIDLVRQLRSSPTVHSTTPVLMITSSRVGRAERLDALGAGAWDVLTHPVDPNELILRVDTFVKAKQEADRVRDEGLTDPATGFYNIRGILRRAQEISADAARFDRPVTCIAFGPQLVGKFSPESEEATQLAAALGEPVAAALREVTRVSDTIGRLGPGEFVVVAPGTDQGGAVRLADRVLDALEGHPDSSIGAQELAQIRAGFYAIEGEEAASPEDLLLRATLALRRAQTDGSFRIRSYEA